ncbi:MAG: hypothetical protein K8L91_07660, partial [Anaerolineae bacterium]|nr:hypothetical protein [Anaerolineae bacterium]
MKFQKFFTPFTGEWVIGVSPKPEPRPRAGWQRRLNLYTGRNLSDVALQMEQTGRAGRLALRGQMLSAGVIAGLEIGLETALEPVMDSNGRPVIDPETQQPQLREGHYFLISSGHGMAASGEDVRVPRALRVEVGDVPVYTLASALAGAGDSAEGEPTGQVNDRRLGPSLREFIAMPALPATFPRAGILVFRPVVVDVVGNYDPTDPCEQDPANYAYEDWQRVDGCQLVLYTWPNEWRALPEASAGRWQNRIAYTIFEAELSLGPDGSLPWEQIGVPIALVGFDTDWTPLFVDRYAVVRDGGRYARRATLINQRGDPFLWQARVRQLVEQVAIMGDAPIADIAAQLRYLPPVGMLPTDAINLESVQKTNHFFPDTYTIDIAPVPLEQLDAVLEANASLQPFDTFTTDQVRVLAPVPQQFFEPALLVTETIAPEFQQAIDEFVIRRNDALRRRANVRRKYAALIKGISGKEPIFVPERDRAEAIEFATAQTVYSGRAHRSANLSGIHQHYFIDPVRVLSVPVGATLYFYVYLDPDHPPMTIMVQFFVQNWDHRAYWGPETIPWVGTSMGNLPAKGRWVRLEVPASRLNLEGQNVTGMAFTLYDGRAAWGSVGTLVAGGQDVVWLDGSPVADNVTTADPEAWEDVPLADIQTPLDGAYGTTYVPADAPATPPPPLTVNAIVDLKTKLAGTPVKFEADTTDPANRNKSAHPNWVDHIGLEAYIRLLDEKIAQADDKIDFGFLRVHTDIYRIRQLVLSNESAIRLAVSPALADIAKGQSASATKEEISSFYDRLKTRPVPPV